MILTKRRAALHNLGCKVNAYETERMAEMLKREGFEIVPFDSIADYYIVNTCSVTNIADRKSRQMLSRARRLNPEGVVIAAGCYVDTRPADAEASDDVDIAVPNSKKTDIVSVIRAWEESHGVDRSGDSGTDEGCVLTGEREEIFHTRKFLKVQDGCNMFCSYCIIPYARGRIRSRALSDVVKEVGDCVKDGASEFVLTGIHLSSYGKDFKEQPEDLISLVKAVSKVEGVKRIRLGSLEPTLVTEETAAALSGIKTLCPHFHLSLQSGSDTVLKRMNRHYTGSEYLRALAILREAFPDPAITTDVIAGFPGETEEELQETADFLNEADIYETHIFPYSRRKGTPADGMDGQLTEKEKKRRVSFLKEGDLKRRLSYRERHRGKEAEVLIEEENEGYTKEYIRVKVPGKELPPGTIIKGILSEGPEEGGLLIL